MRSLLNLFLFASMAASAVAQQSAPAPAVPGMALSSTSIEDGGIIADKYTQKAMPYVSPELEWKNIPAAGAVSYTLIMHDPDNASMKKVTDTLHWMIFNIPGTSTKLDENVTQGTATLPDGTIQAKNARGTVGYLGPGAGALGPYHHYTFELYALDTKLTLGPDATRADVLAAMDGHIVGKAVMFARFHR